MLQHNVTAYSTVCLKGRNGTRRGVGGCESWVSIWSPSMVLWQWYAKIAFIIIEIRNIVRAQAEVTAVSRNFKLVCGNIKRKNIIINDGFFLENSRFLTWYGCIEGK